MKVKVYFELFNDKGEVIDSIKIAEFRSMNWAKPFIDNVKKTEDRDFCKIRVEEDD